MRLKRENSRGNHGSWYGYRSRKKTLIGLFEGGQSTPVTREGRYLLFGLIDTGDEMAKAIKSTHLFSFDPYDNTATFRVLDTYGPILFDQFDRIYLTRSELGSYNQTGVQRWIWLKGYVVYSPTGEFIEQIGCKEPEIRQQLPGACKV